MKLKSKLVKGFFLKRYKRFFCEVKLEDGTIITAHIANTGSMKTCYEDFAPVLLSLSDNPKRKLSHSVELIKMADSWIGVNTARPNEIVYEALQNQLISSFKSFDQILREQVWGDGRLDFMAINSKTGEKLYIEVKSVTMLGVKQGLVQFPDSKTERGAKHIKILQEIKSRGHRAVLLFVVNRENGQIVQIAEEIDPYYAQTLREALKLGVEVMAHQVEYSTDSSELSLCLGPAVTVDFT